MSGNRSGTIKRIGVVAAFVALLVGFILWQTSNVRGYEQVREGYLYQATAQSPEEFAAAALKIEPQGIILAGSDQELNEPTMASAFDYAAKNHLKFLLIHLGAGVPLTPEQYQNVAKFVSQPRNQPTLLLDTDGVRGAKIAAVYRLREMKLPAEQVEKLAAAHAPDAKSADELREFVKTCN